MNREIKFRGFTQTFKNNFWVEGNLIQRDNGEHIIIDREPVSWDIPYHGYEVSPETVGQFTGLYDKNGKAIYEDDVAIYHLDDDSVKGKIVLKESAFYFEYGSLFAIYQGLGNQNSIRIEVIGNIHENPEILEK